MFEEVGENEPEVSQGTLPTQSGCLFSVYLVVAVVEGELPNMRTQGDKMYILHLR